MSAKPELVSIEAVVDAYLAHQQSRVLTKTPEIKARTWFEIKVILTEFRDFVGTADYGGGAGAIRPARPGESRLMRWIEEKGQRFGWYAYNKRIGCLSSMWLWAEDPIEGVLGRPFRLRSLLRQKKDGTGGGRSGRRRGGGDSSGGRRRSCACCSTSAAGAAGDVAASILRGLRLLGLFGSAGDGDPVGAGRGDGPAHGVGG